jgi:hypothetical protein
MDFTVVISIVVGILTIGGVGFKLNAELSKIRIMLEVFMAETKSKLEAIIKLEKRLEKLEQKVYEGDK